MKEITLNIDGVTCKGLQGDTILEVAQKGGVNIPTLCYLKGLTPIGACRMCVVQVEGNPKMLPACTSPATDGMIVHTKTEKLVNYRREVLELLFAGRNHFCMFCSQSGDCELQKLAIDHGMDRVRYPYLYATFENDATDPDLMMDHDRCVLCLRCMRVCAEKVGAHTLDLGKRGWNARIIADLGKRLGESKTCVHCGACAQACPTGTITIREFAYRGKRNQCDDIVESVCPLCSVGCKIKAYVRTGSIARVEGSNLEGPDAGQLCHLGRWGLPESTERERVATPMIREGAMFREATWEEALKLVASKLRPANEKKRAGMLVSSLCADEELSMYAAFFRDALQMDNVDTFDGDILRGFMKGFAPFREQGVRPFTAAHNILKSDLVITLCADPQKEAPVVASYIRVGVLQNGAGLINISCSGNPFAGLCDMDVRMEDGANAQLIQELAESIAYFQTHNAEESDEYPFGQSLHTDTVEAPKPIRWKDVGQVDRLVSMLVRAERPVFVLGEELSRNPDAVQAVVNLAIASKAFFQDGIGIVPLLSSGNSLGAAMTCMAKEPWLGKKDLDFLYVYSTGLVPEDEASLAAISATRFTVIRTPYLVYPLVNLADVLLPAPAWYEKSGHFYTIEGERRRLNVIVPPSAELKGISEILEDLARELKISFKKSENMPCEELYSSQLPPEKARMVAL